MERSAGSRVFTVVAALALLPAAGCVRYDIETTIRGDGSGVRSLNVTVPEGFENKWDISFEGFRRLFGVAEENGWTYKKVMLPPGETLLPLVLPEKKGPEAVAEPIEAHLFRRDTEIPHAESWAGQSGDIRIVGLVQGDSVSMIGVGVKVRDEKGFPIPTITFENSIQVTSGWYDDRPTRTYRETFRWDNLTEVLADDRIRAVQPRIDREYPRLTPERRGELIGLLRGGIWSAVEQGSFTMKESERAEKLAPLVDRLTRQCVALVRQDEPGAADSVLRDRIEELIVHGEETDDARIEKLPGVALAYNTEFTLRLKMEGKVLETNAQERQDDALLWRFTPAEAMARPVEIYAKVQLKMQ
jgi:hypothetical protein